MGENKRANSYDQKQAKLIPRKKGDEETGQKQEREGPDQEHSANESPLLADGGENVVVMHRRRREEAQFDLGVRRLEAFAGPAARTDRDQRLVDRPRRPLLVDLRMDERGP